MRLHAWKASLVNFLWGFGLVGLFGPYFFCSFLNTPKKRGFRVCAEIGLRV